MRAAGIEQRLRPRRKRGIDYNAEVAFEQQPALGFYDTAEEQARTKELGQEFRPATLEEMEGRRRKVPLLLYLSLIEAGLRSAVQTCCKSAPQAPSPAIVVTCRPVRWNGLFRNMRPSIMLFTF